MINFLFEYARLIAQEPGKVCIEDTKLDNGMTHIILSASKIDTGKLIGKDGKIINAIKNVTSLNKECSNFKITVKSIN